MRLVGIAVVAVLTIEKFEQLVQGKRDSLPVPVYHVRVPGGILCLKKMHLEIFVFEIKELDSKITHFHPPAMAPFQILNPLIQLAPHIPGFRLESQAGNGWNCEESYCYGTQPNGLFDDGRDILLNRTDGYLGAVGLRMMGRCYHNRENNLKNICRKKFLEIHEK